MTRTFYKLTADHHDNYGNIDKYILYHDNFNDDFKTLATKINNNNNNFTYDTFRTLINDHGFHDANDLISDDNSIHFSDDDY